MRFPFFPVIAMAALGCAPPDMLKGDPAKLLMPFLGLFMAGIFPAISLTIGSLKSGGFSVQRVEALADELSRLLIYLQALFLVALIACFTLVSAETLHWGSHFPYPNYSSRIFNAVLGICFGVLVSALPKIRGTFRVLLKISRDIAVDEAASKVRDRAAKIPSAIDRFPTKEKFGELFEASALEDKK